MAMASGQPPGLSANTSPGAGVSAPMTTAMMGMRLGQERTWQAAVWTLTAMANACRYGAAMAMIMVPPPVLSANTSPGAGESATMTTAMMGMQLSAGATDVAGSGVGLNCDGQYLWYADSDGDTWVNHHGFVCANTSQAQAVGHQ